MMPRFICRYCRHFALQGAASALTSFLYGLNEVRRFRFSHQLGRMRLGPLRIVEFFHHLIRVIEDAPRNALSRNKFRIGATSLASPLVRRRKTYL